MYPKNTTDREYNISIEDEKIASYVDGKIIGNKIGTTTIKVESLSGIVAVAVLNVKPVLASEIEVFKQYDGSFYVGDQKEFNATILPSDVTNKDITWESSDTEVLRIKNGIAKALKAGEVTITAKSEASDVQGSITIKIYPIEINSIELSSSKESLRIGDTLSVKVKYYPDNGTTRKVTFSSSDENIATVSSSGKVKGIAVGTVVITAITENGKSDSLTIDVKKASSTSTDTKSFSGSSTVKKYVINTNTGKFHKSSCYDIKKMKDEHKWAYSGSRQEVINMGYDPCKHCNP